MAKEVSKKEAGLPAYLKDKKMQGAGVSTDQADMLIPMLRILQALSPEVEKKGISYLPGAEPGMGLLKNAPNPLIDMDKGILFQPVYANKAVVEWIPRQSGGGGGGGFVGTYPEMPKTATQVPDPNNPKRMLTVNKENGNLLVETRYHGGFIIDEEGKAPPMPAVIPFSSTGHTVAKGWNTLMAQKIFEGQRVDSWAVYYRIRTRLKVRGTQSWYIFDITDAATPSEENSHLGYVAPTPSDFDRGKALYDSLASGKMKFEQGVADDGDHDDDGKM